MVKPSYKQTEIGVIPEEWDVYPLGNIARFHDSKRIPIKESDRIKMQGDYPYYGASGIIDYVNDYIFDGNYILLGEDGANIIDRSSRLAFVVSGKCWINNHAHVIEPHENMDIHFLSEYLESISYDEYNTGTAQPKLNREKCNAIPVPVPPLSEQVCIANYLRDCDCLIATIEKEVSKKKAIKQGAMQELLTGKKRLPGFSSEWKQKLFSDACEICARMVDPTQMEYANLPHIGNESIEKFTGRITHYNKVKEDQLISGKYLFGCNDVLYGKINPHFAKAAFPMFEGLCSADMYPISCKEDILPEYLLYILLSIEFTNYTVSLSKRSGIPKVNREELADYMMLLPSLDEQKEIANVLCGIDLEIDSLILKLAKYRQVKQGMMQQLLTGKIRLVDTAHVIHQTEPVASSNDQAIKPVHNHQFDDAVSIAAIVDAFYSDKYPLGRVKVQKLLYLLHRHQATSVSAFKKKAAGPYADTVRYKGGEPIAKKNKYITSKSGKQGTRFFKGENIAQALEYVDRWGMQADIEWLKKNFLRTTRNDLELFATVDMAMCDLKEAGIPVSVAAIKNLLASSKEWNAKLEKPFFTDSDIARAIKKCAELFI